MSKETVEDFCSSLCDLTVNSKPHINMLTMLAEDYIDNAPDIVKAVEDQLRCVLSDVKLPVLYLIDSIVKNVGKTYVPLFSKNIVQTFVHAFEKVDEKARSQMYKLRQTWVGYFPAGKLYALDTKVNSIDPAWPITAAPASNSIHLNPLFLATSQPLPIPADKNREFLKQKKELLELQKMKVDLELLQTQAKLEEQKARVGATVPQVAGIVKIPPATNIILKARASIAEPPKPKQTPVVAHVAPVRIRDPRLRRDAPKETISPASPDASTTSSPRIVLSPVSSPSNSQPSSSESPSKPAKKDKKSKKIKEARLSRKNDEKSPPRPKEKSQKVSRAVEVLRDLEEELSREKGGKVPLGTETVINKAKQHEQMLQPKKNSSKSAASSKNSASTKSTPEASKVAEVAQDRVVAPIDKPDEVPPKAADSDDRMPEAPPPPVITALPRSPASPKRKSSPVRKASPAKRKPSPSERKSPTRKASSGKKASPGRRESPSVRLSPVRTPPPPPIIESPLLSTSSKTTTPEESPKRKKGARGDSKTPSPRPKKLMKKVMSKRKRQGSPSPKSSPKRKTPTRQSTPPTVPVLMDKDPPNASILETETLLDSGHDTDLRMLTAKNMELESSPTKKGKNETLEDLFGKEDVDLRALPPPPPIISRPTPPASPSPSSHSPERTKSWANLKRSNSESTPDSSKRMKRERRKSDRFNHHKEQETTEDEPGFDDPASEEAAKERAEMIMKNAEEQLSNGNITFAQYNNLLKEVITMNEKRKLKEAMRRDQEDFEYEPSKSRSPSPEGKEEPLNVYSKRRKFGEGPQSPSNKDKTFDGLPPAPPPPDISDRDFRFRDDRRRDDRGRYGDRRDKSRYEHRNLPSKGPWMGNQQPIPPMRPGMRNRGRWPPMVGPGRPFDGPRFGPPMMNYGGMIPPNREVPPADPSVLEMIAKDPMKTINIDGVPRDIRFYGETAVIMMAWDDPRELNFQPGSRRVTFNDRESFLLQFNAPYQEVCVEGVYCKIRLGAPSRELYVDGMFYSASFGGPPLQVRVGNLVHSVRLHGPLPNVRIGNESRRDLVAGKVSLVVDGTDFFAMYLDAKPQTFDIGGVPYILRFVEALQTVVINGVPFKFEFGSNLPVPMFFHGEKHYLRFSALPKGIKPGYLTIINMEGGRLPSPPPMLPPPMMPGIMSPVHTQDVVVPGQAPLDGPESIAVKPDQQPLELLTSLMPSFSDRGLSQSYTVEENSNHPSDTSMAPTAATSTAAAGLGSINVTELLKKLQAVGIMPTADKKPEKIEETTTEIIPVSFENPESLRTRQPGLIHALYSGMQCSSCGVRFPPEQTGKYSQHLDWHFRQNRRERDAMRVAQSRRYNYDVSDWIQFQEIEEKEDRAQSWFEIQEKRNFESEEAAEDDQSVPAGEKGENACCEICHDKFDQFYNEEKEEWHLRRAIEADGKLYHPMCYRDREEKINSSVIEAPKLDKPLLLVPTEEPELIEIPDDREVVLEPVLGMAIDSDKVETIDLDSEQSNSKDGEDMPKKEEEEQPEDDDDDILECEVIDPKIETYELSDEEKEPEGQEEESLGVEEVEDGRADEEMEVDLGKVKKEKVEVVDLDAQTLQPLVVSSIDGNVELEDAAPVSLPKRIVINIPSAVTKPAPAPAPSPEPKTIEPPPVPLSEPPPPGEELFPLSVKPKVSQSELKVLPPVNKGSELSALCSIM